MPEEYFALTELRIKFWSRFYKHFAALRLGLNSQSVIYQKVSLPAARSVCSLPIPVSPHFPISSQRGPRKILLENSLVTRAARGHHVCAFLAESEAVTESAAAKHEIRSATRDLESR